MGNRKKIVIVTSGAFPVPAVRGGGAEGLVQSIAEQNELFNHLDLTIVSIFNEKAKKEAQRFNNTHFHFISPGNIYMSADRAVHYLAFDILHRSDHLAYKTTLQRLHYIYQTAVYLNRNSFDIIVFENQMALLWTLRYKNNFLKYRNKYAIHIHNHPARYARNEKYAIQARKIIVVSEFIGRSFANNIGTVYDKKQFTVLKNAVDEKQFNPEAVNSETIRELRNKYGAEDKNIILFVGRLIEGKGVRELLKAYELIQNDNDVLMILGSMNYDSNDISPYEQELRDIVSRIQHGKVVFTGYIDHSKLADYYAMADVVVLPSTCEEAAGLVVIESLMMNRPTITTTMGGIPEYAPENCAILLNNDSNLIENIAGSVKKLLDDKNLQEYYMNNQRETVKGWKLSSYYENFAEIMEEF